MRFKVGNVVVADGFSAIKGDIVYVDEKNGSYQVVWRTTKTVEFDNDEILRLDKEPDEAD